jgi:hypothetical protein
MKKLLSFLLLSTVLTITTFAADNIAKGASVKILEIAKSDSYYEERAELLGKEATALSELVKSSDGFYSGTLETTGGRTIFFTSVKVSAKSSTVSTKTSGTTSTTSKVKAPLFTGSTIPKGSQFVIIEVPSDDAYYSDRADIEGQTGTTSSEMTLEDDGYTSGSVEIDNGKSYYFYKVKLGKSTSTAPTKSSSTATTKTTTTAKTPKFITGTIKKGTTVYVAEISEDDSYYSDRFKMVGSKGKIGKNDLEMKENGWYSGDFSFDDGSTAYFYKVKFSKEPVDKLVKTADEETKSNNSDDDDWGYYFDDPTPTKDKTVSSGNDVSWEDASNDDNIKEGDNIKIIAVSPEDSYYDDRDEYEGKLGVAGDDLEYDSESGGYGGSVKLDRWTISLFLFSKTDKNKKRHLAQLNQVLQLNRFKSSSTIAKGKRVIVTDLSSDDSFYSDKSKYIRKKGKVAEGLNEQSNGFYSGKILFDDGTDAYFYKVKVNVLD